MSQNFVIEPDLKLVDGAYEVKKANYIFEHVLAPLLSDTWLERAYEISANASLVEKSRNRVVIEAPIFIQLEVENTPFKQKLPITQTMPVMEGYVLSRHRFELSKDAEKFLRGLVNAKIDYLTVHMPEATRGADDATVEDINRQIECAEGRIKNLLTMMDKVSRKLRETDSSSIEINIPIRMTVANLINREFHNHSKRAFT